MCHHIVPSSTRSANTSRFNANIVLSGPLQELIHRWVITQLVIDCQSIQPWSLPAYSSSQLVFPSVLIRHSTLISDWPKVTIGNNPFYAGYFQNFYFCPNCVQQKSIVVLERASMCMEDNCVLQFAQTAMLQACNVAA